MAQGDRLGTSPYSSPGAWEREGGGGGKVWEVLGGNRGEGDRSSPTE